MKDNIVLTFDDTPVESSAVFTAEQRLTKILSTLNSLQLQAVFFVRAERINSTTEPLLDFLDQQGQFIGNHSFGHHNTIDISKEKYVENIVKADTLLSKYKSFRKWFRYPFLDEGNTAETNQYINASLCELGYLNYYVTVPTYDYFLDNLFQQALRDNAKLNTQGVIDLYVSIIFDSITFYTLLAKHLLNKSPNHIVLLHENDITALALPSLIKKLKSSRWNIISPAGALDSSLSDYPAKTFPVRLGKITQIAQDLGLSQRFPRTIDEEYLTAQWREHVLDATLGAPN